MLSLLPHFCPDWSTSHTTRAENIPWSLFQVSEGHPPGAVGKGVGLVPLLSDPRSHVLKDLNNQEVDGEHEERALQPNHHFLPSKFNFT